MEKRKRKTHASARAPNRGRLIVTYTNGTWSDNLEIRNQRVVLEAPEMVVCIEVGSRRRPSKVRMAEEALAGFVANIDRLHTLQIGKKALRKMLDQRIRAFDQALVALRVSANGHERTYPASLVFGPDEVTLNLG